MQMRRQPRCGARLNFLVLLVVALSAVRLVFAAPPAEPTTVSLRGLTEAQVTQVLKRTLAEARKQMGYEPATKEQAFSLPKPPGGLTDLTTLARASAEGVFQLQVARRTGDNAALWVYGQYQPDTGDPSANDETGIIERLAVAVRTQIAPDAPIDPPPPAEGEDDAAPDAPQPPKPQAPGAPTGKFIPQPQLSPFEAAELIDVVETQVSLSLGYAPANAHQVDQLKLDTTRIEQVRTLARPTVDGLRIVQFGYRTFASQPLHLWVFGALATDEGLTVNPDVEQALTMIEEARKIVAEAKKNTRPIDLAVGEIDLSFIEADRCLGVLKALGYQTIEYKAAGGGVGKAKIVTPTSQIDPTNLPAVMAMPDPESTDLVGGSKARGGQFGLAITPSIAEELPAATSGSPVMSLMVFYDPAHPEQYAEVLNRIRRTLDKPARQILIEAMVLEISETGLDQLGVEWQLDAPEGNIESLRLGTLPTFTAGNNGTVDAELRDIFGEFTVKIQALLSNGEAEILSRPSVLTIDNRQAAIRVGEEVPVATSVSGLRGGDRISFDFKYIPIGILLNVRPRVAHDGEEVTLQVDGIVSAEVPGEDLVITDNTANANIVARAPQISTRRVQTYTRIANNTPFIIGGLVAKDITRQKDKVPLLGDIPIIGALFSNSRVDRLKREVIIVITPYVLPENQVVGRNLPKDEDAFDSFGNQLFRDMYRIRAEDVFDLTFLRTNQQLRKFQALADQVAAVNDDLARRYPVNQFVDGRIPGEQTLVYRQMYEVIKRLDLDEQIDFGRLIFFLPSDESERGFSVTFLERFLRQKFEIPEDQFGGKAGYDHLDAALDGKAVAITYTLARFDPDPADILSQPVADVTIVDCADEAEWGRLLWQMNQPDEEGRQRYTILLRNVDDIQRLKRAILLKQTVELNASRTTLTLNNFSLGRLLLVPSLKKDKVHLVDEQAAKYFLMTEHYYPVLRNRMTRAIEDFQEALEDPEMQELLRMTGGSRRPDRFDRLAE